MKKKNWKKRVEDNLSSITPQARKVIEDFQMKRKKTIKNVLDELEERLFTGDRPMKEDLDQARKEISEIIDGCVPEEITRKVLVGDSKHIRGWNACREQMKKNLREIL